MMRPSAVTGNSSPPTVVIVPNDRHNASKKELIGCLSRLAVYGDSSGRERSDLASISRRPWEVRI
jgi:hypothetical protein